MAVRGLALVTSPILKSSFPWFYCSFILLRKCYYCQWIWITNNYYDITILFHLKGVFQDSSVLSLENITWAIYSLTTAIYLPYLQGVDPQEMSVAGGDSNSDDSLGIFSAHNQ
jgi:hypothetical protein